MTNLFFYGTLRFRPLLELVLCEPGVSLNMVSAQLPDHQVYGVQGQPFPMVAPAPGQSASGVLVRGLTARQIERLDYYEGGFDYDLRPMTLRVSDAQTAEAQVFFPRDGAWTPGDVWSLDDWALAWGEMTLHAATEVMAFYDRLGPTEIAKNFRAIRVRAAGRIAAAARTPDPQHDVTRDVVVEKHNRGYLNYFAMDDMDLRHRRYDGTMSDSLNRAALMTGQAAVVLPYDPIRDRVLLVEQFRAPVFMIGDPAPWVWEAVAGMIDPGETPEQAAHRELLEEAHLTARRLEPAGQAYSSSGSSSEFVHLFVAIADLLSETDSGGLDSEGEDIRSRILSFDTLLDLTDRQQIKSLPLVSLANWLARHRDRLRQ